MSYQGIRKVSDNDPHSTTILLVFVVMQQQVACIRISFHCFLGCIQVGIALSYVITFQNISLCNFIMSLQRENFAERSSVLAETYALDKYANFCFEHAPRFACVGWLFPGFFSRFLTVASLIFLKGFFYQRKRVGTLLISSY